MENQEPFSTMIVSDDAASSFLITCQLEQSGWFQRPLVFREVSRALAYIEEKSMLPLRQTCLNLPQVLFVDAQMPGKDGFYFLEALWNVYSNLYKQSTVCFLTLSKNQKHQAKALKMGADFYWEKPLRKTQISQIRERLRQKSELEN